MTKYLEAVRITFPFYDDVAKLLGETHSSNPPYRRQSTSAIPQITIDNDESESSDEDGLPQSSDRSRDASTASSKNEVNWAEEQFKIDFGDDDDVLGSIENFLGPEDSNIDEFAYDDTASKATGTSNTRLHDVTSSSKSGSMNFVKQPPLFKRNTDVNATTPIPKKRQRLAKKSTVKSDIDEAWESQSARDHEAYMAKLQVEEQRIALEREQGERRHRLEEERLELDRQRTQQQADQMNQILSY